MAKKEQQELASEDHLAKAKEFRAKLHASAEVSKKEIEETREDFRRFFIKMQHEMKLEKSLEGIIWKHLVSIGCASKEKFKDGVKHFGINIK